MTENMWSYNPESHYNPGTNLVGFKVEAGDGHIGKVDEATAEVGSSYIVVDTGPWIFGKAVLLPAGTVVRVDMKEEKVHVNLTKEQIKNSPSTTRTSTAATPPTARRSASTTAARWASDRLVRRAVLTGTVRLGWCSSGGSMPEFTALCARRPPSLLPPREHHTAFSRRPAAAQSAARA